MAEQLAFDILAKDVNASRTFRKVGDAAEDAGDSFKGMAKDSELLGKQIEDTEKHLTELRKEFARTGDVSLKKIISANERDLAFLNKIKKSVADIGDESEDVGPTIRRNVIGSLRDSLSSLPSELKGAAIVGAVGVGLAMAPLLGAAVAGAVLGGVGTGGIIGGIALAAQDERVATAGKQLGQHLLGELKADGQAFVGPLLVAIDQVDDATTDLLSDVGDEFRDLSKLVVPLSRGLSGLIRNLGPGLGDALEKSGPVIRAIADELPELGDSISYMLKAISSQSDGATLGWISLLNIVEEGVEGFGNIVAGLSATYEWLVRTTHAVAEGEAGFLGLAAAIAPFGFATGWVDDQTESLIEDLDKAKASSETFGGSVDGLGRSMEEQAQATKDARQALVAYGKSIADQFDPTANLVHRLQDLKTSQKELNEAIKEHGRNSQEAKDAELALAEASLAVNQAALAAQGTFDGKFDPALRKILHDGGLTEAQIRDIEASFRAATAAGNSFAKSYRAQLILDTSRFYGSLAAARNAAEGNEYVSGRASGGPVSAGKTYMVGEEGPELVTFGQDGFVHNASSTKAMLAGTSGGSSMPGQMGGTVAVSVSVVPSASARDKLAELVLEMLRVDAGFRSTVAGYVGGS